MRGPVVHHNYPKSPKKRHGGVRKRTHPIDFLSADEQPRSRAWIDKAKKRRHVVKDVEIPHARLVKMMTRSHENTGGAGMKKMQFSPDSRRLVGMLSTKMLQHLIVDADKIVGNAGRVTIKAKDVSIAWEIMVDVLKRGILSEN
jgi:histone H3/H4